LGTGGEWDADASETDAVPQIGNPETEVGRTASESERSPESEPGKLPRPRERRNTDGCRCGFCLNGSTGGVSAAVTTGKASMSG
jgi:hypothetical protein